VVRAQSRPSLSESLADTLRKSILAGEYRPGDRLPPERQLAGQRGVGRGTVREAFRKLEQLGLVDIRHGGGVTVRSLDQASLDLVRHLIVADGRPDRHVIEQTIEVAEALVGATARLALERGSPADLEGARERLAAMRCPDLDDVGYFVAEQEFMRRLEAASGNFVLCLLRNALSALLTLPQREQLGGALRPPAELLDSIAKQIDVAIEAREARGVEEGLLRLLAHRRQRILALVELAQVEPGRAPS
jgi:GntR family transcriptional repressor for pyruvate dehydrogenase complex